MPAQNIKISHEAFNYFRFQIPAKIKIEELTLKLKQLYKLNQVNNNDTTIKINIILDFVGIFTNIEIEQIITEIKNILLKHNLSKIIVYAIAANATMNLHNVYDICGIPVIDTSNNVTTIKNNVVPNQTLTITEPIRSGMKITHDADIVVTNLVSNNAEVISCGNIHIYDDAKGRLIAGSSGDKSARIFVLRFDAELIAIGGIYRTIDAKLPDTILRKSVMIYLDGREKLNIVPLKI